MLGQGPGFNAQKGERETEREEERERGRETQIKSQKLPGKVLVLFPVLQLPGRIPVPCVVYSPLLSSFSGCTPPDAHLASAAPRRCSQASLLGSISAY